MKRIVRRMVLSAAALSPGVVAISMQELAISIAFMLLGITGAISAGVAAVAVSPKLKTLVLHDDADLAEYRSLLLPSALKMLENESPDPVQIRAQLRNRLLVDTRIPGFMTHDDEIGMALSHIMAQWDTNDVLTLSDAQARELWLVNRLLSASPAEAGALAVFFSAPNAMLAVRDRVARREYA